MKELWKTTKLYKNQLSTHISSYLLCGAVYASSLLSLKHGDILFGVFVSPFVALLLFMIATWLFLLNVDEAESAFKNHYCYKNKCLKALVAILYFMPMYQLTMVISLGVK